MEKRDQTGPNLVTWNYGNFAWSYGTLFIFLNLSPVFFWRERERVALSERRQSELIWSFIMNFDGLHLKNGKEGQNCAKFDHLKLRQLCVKLRQFCVKLRHALHFSKFIISFFLMLNNFHDNIYHTTQLSSKFSSLGV